MSRWATGCGLLAPASFVGGWLVSGARTPGYSPVDQAISQLAREGAPTRLLMTGAFMGFGLLLPVYARTLSRAVGSPALRAAMTAAGVTTLGVAAFPLARTEGGAQDLLHALWASSGYVAMSASPLIAGQALAVLGHRRAAWTARTVGLLSAASLVASVTGAHPGLFQRAGLTVVDVWFAGMAVVLLRDDGAFG